MLIVPGNFEHLLPARTLLVDVLATVPNVRILVTSRVLSQVRGDHQFPVSLLPFDAGAGPGREGAALVPLDDLPATRRLVIVHGLAVYPDLGQDEDALDALDVIARFRERPKGLPLAYRVDGRARHAPDARRDRPTPARPPPGPGPRRRGCPAAPTGSSFPIGTMTVRCTATDANGDASAAQTFTVTVLDRTGPVITFVGGPQPGRTCTPATLPAEPTCTATDTSSTVTQGRVYGYSTAPGTHPLTAHARDAVGRRGTPWDAEGNSSVSARTYTVPAPTRPPRR